MTSDDQARRAYIEEWRRILSGVLRWADADIEAWVRRQHNVLHNEYLTHDNASWYVAPAMIAEELRHRLGAETHVLRRRIDEVLHDARAPEPNWLELRTRIAKILSEYGGNLPPCGPQRAS